MTDWNPIHSSNLTAGELLALILFVFGSVIVLIILVKVVKIAKK